MILTKKKTKFDSFLLTNLVFAFFPIAFILGNLFINLNLLLFCCIGIFHLKSKFLKDDYDYIIKIIFLFFFLVFVSTALSFIKSSYVHGFDIIDFERLIKSILFFRFFLLLVVICFLIKYEILNTKYFFICCAFFPIFISLDVTFQYIFGFNIIGLKNFITYIDTTPIPGSEGAYNSSFFGDEKIAGSYINSFSFFSIIFLIFTLKNENKFKSTLIITAISILGTGILLSGNRMPIILFLIGLFLLFILKKNIKKIIILSYISLFLIYSSISLFDERRAITFKYFYLQFKDGIALLSKPKEKTEIANQEKKKIISDDFEFFWVTPDTLGGHMQLILTALDIWDKNKFFGNGIKSFRKDCGKLQAHQKNRLCSNHPHNYYIEILTESGVLGLACISIIGFFFIIFIFKNFKILGKNNKENLILLAATTSLILETFPLKSTGSIFTTYNATYIILIAGILLSYKKKLFI